MYSKVKILRVRGTRRSDREIYADPGVVGHLAMCQVASWLEIKLFAPGTDARPEPIIPVLFDPVLVAMHGNKMLFRGLERQGDQRDANSATVMQEWSVQVMVEQPADIAHQPHRTSS
ncbi:hypothetical protein [Massilia antarctica]|uniref:hypothetical protein n=1 Tax=Massilia antarctica TaxID=2765360 RepID=UPI00226E46C8|nr:hypothetical protein [Massilia sp. H27-R4]MCY0910821.1 hypothetical protein [Massilia sp. H27-R4]